MKKQKQMYRCMEDRKYRNGKTTRCPTKTLGHDRRCGFTLVELVIVIAIVIILSVISVPIYRGYVDKAKWAEGYALLGSILSAQKAYYSEYGNFLLAFNSSSAAGRSGGGIDFTSNETVLGIDARGNKYFTRFQVGWSSDVNSAFEAGVYVPEDLRDNIGGNNQFLMLYNVVSGINYRYRTGSYY